MAVLQKVRLISGERLDLPDFLNIESFACADFAQFMDKFMCNSSCVIKGFDISSPRLLIGPAPASISINIANSVMFAPTSALAGGAFYVASTTEPAQTASLTSNATNYIELDQTVTTGAPDTRSVWDPSANGGQGAEFKQLIDTVSFLDAVVTSNTVGFTSGKIPLAKIVVDNSPVPLIVSITDCRPLFFRLGSGGNTPDALKSFTWPNSPAGYSRTDSPTTITAASPAGSNPFAGSDKNIRHFKDWIDAVMSRIKEITGSAYWFTNTGGLIPGASLSNLYWDALGSQITGQGVFKHDASTAGKLIWTGAIIVESLAGEYNFQIAASNVILANGQVAYITQVRHQPLSSGANLTWTNAVASIDGAVGAFTGLVIGDWIKKESDGYNEYIQIVQFWTLPGGAGAPCAAAVAQSVTTSTTYLGTTGSERGQYAKGLYTVSTAAKALVPNSADIWWLAYRNDGGTSTPRIYLRNQTALNQGEYVEIFNYADSIERILKPIINPSGVDTTIRIYPSQRNYLGKKRYTYIMPNISSKFPRTALGAYDGGAIDDNLSIVDFTPNAGNVDIGITLPSVVRAVIASIPAPAVGFYPVLVYINIDDSVGAIIGGVQATLNAAKLDDNLPVAAVGAYPVAIVVVEVTGAGPTIANIDENRLLDRRPLGSGGSGGTGSGSSDYDKHQDALAQNSFSEIYIDILDNNTSLNSANMVNATYDIVNSRIAATKNAVFEDYEAEVTGAIPAAPWVVDGNVGYASIVGNELRINDVGGADHLYYKQTSTDLASAVAPLGSKLNAEIATDVRIASTTPDINNFTGLFIELNDEQKVAAAGIFLAGGIYTIGFLNATKTGLLAGARSTVILPAITRNIRIVKIGSHAFQLYLDGALIDTMPYTSFSATGAAGKVAWGCYSDTALIDAYFLKTRMSVFNAIVETVDLARKPDVTAFYNDMRVLPSVTGWSQLGTAAQDITTYPGYLYINDNAAGDVGAWSYAIVGESQYYRRANAVLEAIVQLKSWTASAGALNEVAYLRLRDGTRDLILAITATSGVAGNQGLAIAASTAFAASVVGYLPTVGLDFVTYPRALKIEKVGDDLIRIYLDKTLLYTVQWEDLPIAPTTDFYMAFGSGDPAGAQTQQVELLFDSVYAGVDTAPIDLPVVDFLGSLTLDGIPAENDVPSLWFSSDNGLTWCEGANYTAAALEVAAGARGGSEIIARFCLSKNGTYINDWSVMYNGVTATSPLSKYYEYVAVGGETVIALPFSYVVGAHDLQVLENGLELYEGVTKDYLESGPAQITLNYVAVVGDRYKFRTVISGTAAGAGLWSRIGTTLVPTTAGDNVDLNTAQISAGVYTAPVNATLQITSRENDGVAAIGAKLDCSAALTTNGSKVLSIQNATNEYLALRRGNRTAVVTDQVIEELFDKSHTYSLFQAVDNAGNAIVASDNANALIFAIGDLTGASTNGGLSISPVGLISQLSMSHVGVPAATQQLVNLSNITSGCYSLLQQSILNGISPSSALTSYISATQQGALSIAAISGATVISGLTAQSTAAKAASLSLQTAVAGNVQSALLTAGTAANNEGRVKSGTDAGDAPYSRLETEIAAGIDYAELKAHTLDVYESAAVRARVATTGLGLVAGGYISFDLANISIAGYGFRDNAGVIEWKDSGGAWASITSFLSILSSPTSINAYIDNDATSAAETFTIYHDVTVPTVGKELFQVNESGNVIIFGNILPSVDGAGMLGDSTFAFESITLDNAATDGGAIYFNGALGTFIKCNAAGTILSVSGFTSTKFDGDVDATGLSVLAAAIKSETNLSFFMDTLTAGGQTFQWYNGTPTQVMGLDENGHLTIYGNLIPDTGSTGLLGTSAAPFESISLDKGVTDGGAVYFNAGTTSYLKSSADGLTLDIAGFTLIEPSTDATMALGTAGKSFKSLQLDNGVTDGGAVYFNTATTSFLKSSTDGLTLTAGGWTSILPGSHNTCDLGADLTRFKDIYYAGILYGGASPMRLQSKEADGGSAVAFELKSAAFTTAGAKLFSILNNTTEKFAVDKDGIITGKVLSTGSSVARTLANRFSEIYNVLDWGLVNDGVLGVSGTDNATALQALINTVGAAGGGTIFFPPGVYRIDSQLTLGAYNGIKLLGDSFTNTYLDFTFAVAITAGEGCIKGGAYYTAVEDLTFYTAGTAQISNTNTALTAGTEWSFYRKIRIKGTNITHCFYKGLVCGSYHSFFEDISSEDGSSNTALSIPVYSSATGIDIRGGTYGITINATNCILNEFRIYQCTNAIDIAGANYATISNGVILSATKDISGTAGNVVTVVGVHFEDTGTCRRDDTTHVSIFGQYSNQPTVVGELDTKHVYPVAAATYDLGSTTYPYRALYLDNGVTDAGAIYFDAGTTDFLRGNATGTELQLGGFTSLNPAAANITDLGTLSLPFKNIYLDHGAATGGGVFFNGGATNSYLYSSADGTVFYFGNAFQYIYPENANIAQLGNNAQGFKALYLDNGATNGGSIYFDGASTSYLQSSTDGLTLNLGGFTAITPLAVGATFDGVDVSAHDHSSSSAQTRLAAKDRRHMTASIKSAADGAAGTATAEHIIFRAQDTITITKAYFLPDAVLTSNDTDYATLKVWRRDNVGATQSAVASANTKTAGSGGTGDWTAFKGVDLGTITNAALSSGQVITIEITKANAGVVVPSGTWQIEFTVD